MMPSKTAAETKVIAGYEVPKLTRSYFMSWGDAWNPYISEWLLLRPALHLKWLTPNIVTIMSIISCLAAGLLLIYGHNSFYVLAAFLLFVTPILDCLDGRLARITKRSSQLGDYLDKTFDVMKIGIISFTMGFAAYKSTGNAAYWGLALSIAFWFMFRYYIKLETIFTEYNRDSTYLERCSVRRQETYEKIEKRRAAIKSPADIIKWTAFIHYRAFNLDETEFITFSVIALLLGKPQYFVILFGIGQPIIALYRHALRGYQLIKDKEALLDPMRK